MKAAIVAAVLSVSFLAGTTLYARDADATYPGLYVKDSAITTKVKTKLLAKHPDVLSNVKVDTDRDGAVWLSGKVPSKEASALAEKIARETDGVRAVHNEIVVEE